MVNGHSQHQGLDCDETYSMIINSKNYSDYTQPCFLHTVAYTLARCEEYVSSWSDTRDSLYELAS